MWLMKALQDKPYGYTLKGVGFPSYYLGADIKRVDKDVVDKLSQTQDKSHNVGTYRSFSTGIVER